MLLPPTFCVPWRGGRPVTLNRPRHPHCHNSQASAGTHRSDAAILWLVQDGQPWNGRLVQLGQERELGLNDEGIVHDALMFTRGAPEGAGHAVLQGGGFIVGVGELARPGKGVLGTLWVTVYQQSDPIAADRPTTRHADGEDALAALLTQCVCKVAGPLTIHPTQLNMVPTSNTLDGTSALPH